MNSCTQYRTPTRLLAVAFVLLITLATAGQAIAITRATVLSRAQSWVDHPVAYSQSKYHLGYRTDCSGYVSMCWQTGQSYCTATFHEVTHRIATADLKPGDALLKAGYHIRLFHHWVDGSHTSFVAYEAGTKVAVVRVHSIAQDLGAGYVPVRYNAILDGPAPDNVIWNGSFDAWDGSWDGSDQPISWQVAGGGYDSPTAHRTDVYHTSHNSLQLTNQSDDPSDVVTVSQTASVTAGGTYRLIAWVRSATDPSGVSIAVRYMGANGSSLAETATTAAACGAGSATWLPVSLVASPPAGTVNAVVSVRLAGGGAPGGVGTSVLVDDVSLTRLRGGITIRAAASSVRAGGSVALTGSVTPTSAVGAAVVVWMQRPGGSWKQLASTSASATPSATLGWAATFAPTRAMRAGTYRFRATVSGIPGYLGASSSIVSVKLK